MDGLLFAWMVSGHGLTRDQTLRIIRSGPKPLDFWLCSDSVKVCVA